MTVEYNHDISTSRGLGNFGRLLIRWKGSIYKLVYPEVCVYVIMYLLIFFIYRFAVVYNPHSRKMFEAICSYCSTFGQSVPVSFVLGFYVSQVVTRWWSQFMICPWPDTLAIMISTHLQGTGERSRLMRRTIMRYVCLSFTICMTMMSPQAKARFPTLDHLVEAGFLMPHEKLIFDHLNERSNYSKYWVPLIWAGGVIGRARREGRIADDQAHNTIVKHLTKFRGGLGDLLGFDWCNLPLVYTQVVTLAVYLYFLACLMGKQILVPHDGSEIDTVFPVFLFVEFFFYVGWLKVGETMLNPWGEDDDDFEVNWMIDRYYCVSYLIVDDLHNEMPEMLKDSYWDEIPDDLPYTQASLKFKSGHVMGSQEKQEKAEPERPQQNNARVSGVDMGYVSHFVKSTKSVHPKPSKASNRSDAQYKMYLDTTFVHMSKDPD